MSAPPPPPPPPPPPASVKSPIAATNRALLTSIEKGTKLKRVPDKEKKDRSAVNLLNTPTNNGPQIRPMNGAQSLVQNQNSGKPQHMANTKIFPDIQSELTNVNLRKVSTPINSSLAVRPVKTNAPPPNQLHFSKPPAPPSQLGKPVSRSSTSELKMDLHDSISKPMAPPPNRNFQPIIPNQMPNSRTQSNVPINVKNPNHVSATPVMSKNSIDSQKIPFNLVDRKTPKPPLPVSKGSTEYLRFQAPVASPPPVPQRNVTSSSSNSPSSINQSRPVSSIGSNQHKVMDRPTSISNLPNSINQSRPASGIGSNQYKVMDRPPPPPPPMNNLIQSNQRSTFDKRFQFPREEYFPKPREVDMKINRSNISRNIETSH